MDYQLQDNIAIVTLDDGKANVVGPALQGFINECLDRAQAEGAGAVILRGREGMFSAGFDLKEFKKGIEATIAMVTGGMELAIRLYGFPMPVVAACPGHGIAMGAFMLLACDTRIGVRGDFNFTLPETRISMEIPRAVQALCHARIPARYTTRAVIQSEIFDPQTAVEAGFLDSVVDAAELDAAAFEAALTMAALPQQSYAANKLFLREATLAQMQEQLDKAKAAAG